MQNLLLLQHFMAPLKSETLELTQVSWSEQILISLGGAVTQCWEDCDEDT